MTAKNSKANPMWGGQYASGPAEAMEKINPSIGFDQKLYAQDIRGSQAHAKMLAKQKILTDAECDAICKGLDTIRAEIESGEFEFKVELEDIHMNIESRLKEIIGEPAGRLHTARSRNDQVATDIRLWVRDALDRTDTLLKELQRTLLTRAEEFSATIMPGFTHLQSAQPVTLGHHLMAYVEMLGRDRGRMMDTRKRLNESPLGSAALAGTSFPLDREFTAKEMGFDGPMRNSLDGVADRDFALEALSACSVTAMHLTRLAEELILWSSAQFNFIRLSDGFTSGSSIMPQKRNPDAAELVRGKSGRIFGSFVTLFTVLKGLPLAYNKDMQEDKEPLFEAFEQLDLCLLAMTGMMADFTANADRMRDAASSGFATATDLADWMVRTLNVPFRHAHHVTANIVKEASTQNCQLSELPLEAMQKFEPRLTEEIFNVLTPEHSAASRKSFGGTSPERVREAVQAARKQYL